MFAINPQLPSQFVEHRGRIGINPVGQPDRICIHQRNYAGAEQFAVDVFRGTLWLAAVIATSRWDPPGFRHIDDCGDFRSRVGRVPVALARDRRQDIGRSLARLDVAQILRRRVAGPGGSLRCIARTDLPAIPLSRRRAFPVGQSKGADPGDIRRGRVYRDCRVNR